MVDGHLRGDRGFILSEFGRAAKEFARNKLAAGAMPVRTPWGNACARARWLAHERTPCTMSARPTPAVATQIRIWGRVIMRLMLCLSGTDLL